MSIFKGNNKFKFLFVSLLFSLLIYGCHSASQRQSKSSSNPQIISPQKVAEIAEDLPSYVRFSYSGLVYFNGKLYASSNIGLLEYENGELVSLYKWYNKDDVISGPWFDKANNLLWCFHNGINKL